MTAKNALARRLALVSIVLVTATGAGILALRDRGDAGPLRVEARGNVEREARSGEEVSCPDPPLRATWLPPGYGPELRQANHEPWGEGRFWETADGRHWIRLDNEANRDIYGNLQNPSLSEPMTVLGGPASIGQANAGLSAEFRACGQGWTLTAYMQVSKFAPNHPLGLADLRRVAEGLEALGNWKPVPDPVLSIDPASGPPGSSVRVDGVGFADRATADPMDPNHGPAIFLVRRGDDGQQWAGALGWNLVGRGGSLHGGGPIPGELAVYREGQSTPDAEHMPTPPGIYQMAVGDPDNLVPDATFEVIAPQVGVGYPNVAYFFNCDVFSTSFDGSYWLADPPIGSSRGTYPGSFTMTGSDRGELRVSDAMPVFAFRRLPPGAAKPGEGCW